MKRKHWVVDEDRFTIRRTQGQFLVLDGETDEYFTVEGCADAILGAILDDRPLDGIRADLKARYPRVPGDTLAADLAAFLRDLSRRGIARQPA